MTLLQEKWNILSVKDKIWILLITFITVGILTDEAIEWRLKLSDIKIKWD